MLGRETWVLLLTAVASGSAAAAIAWYVRDHNREPEDVTLGFIGPSLAAMYLLVLALALATEWQAIGSAQQAVGNEAVAVRQIYWAASGLPPAAGNTLRAQVRGYVTTVIDHDWPEMERGTLDDASLNLLTAMSTSLLEVNTQTSRAANAQSYATGQLGALVTSRAARASAAASRLPIGVLIAVVMTSLIVGVFPFAGGIRSDRASISVAVVQAVLVAVAVVVVFQLNNPFTGPLGTGPGALSVVAAEVGARLQVGAGGEPASCRSARHSSSLRHWSWSPCPRIRTPRQASRRDRTRPGSSKSRRRGIPSPRTGGLSTGARPRPRPRPRR